MIVKKLRLHGSFVEAFLYFDFLWLIRASGEIVAFDIERFLSATVGSDFDPARVVFARNDLLTQPNYRDAAVSAQSVSVQAFLRSGAIDVDQQQIERFAIAFDTRLRARSILDMRCYYGRAYVATDSNVLQFTVFGRSDLKHLGSGTRGNGRLGGAVVHDARCLQFRTQFGVISAACGKDGGYYAVGANSSEATWKASFRRFASQSRATEFLSDTVTNVRTGSELEFYSTERRSAFEDLEQRVEEEEGVDVVIEEVGSQIDSTTVNGEIERVAESRGKHFVRVFLTRSGVFAQDEDRQLHNFRLVEGNRLINPRPLRPFPPAPTDILSLTTCPMGVVAELDDSVVILNRGTWTNLYDSAIFSVRGYPASKWYKNLITVVGEDRAEVLFVCQP